MKVKIFWKVKWLLSKKGGTKRKNKRKYRWKRRSLRNWDNKEEEIKEKNLRWKRRKKMKKMK